MKPISFNFLTRLFVLSLFTPIIFVSCKKDIPLGASECSHCEGKGYSFHASHKYSHPILIGLDYLLGKKDCFWCSGKGYFYPIRRSVYQDEEHNNGNKTNISDYLNNNSCNYDTDNNFSTNNNYQESNIEAHSQTCMTCKGSGHCNVCKGEGQVTKWRNTYDGLAEQYLCPCPNCQSSGVCSACKGEKYIYY